MSAGWNAETERRIAALAPEKRAIFERRLAEQVARTAHGGAIGRRAADAPPAPASFAQQRLWFLENLDPGTARYNVTEAFRLRGPLDVDALGLAVDALIERHAVLRTRLVPREGDLVQVVDRAETPALTIVDVRDDPEHARETHAREIVGSAARRPFDIGAERMFRALLVREAPERHVLALTLHHAAADGLSLAILNNELSLLYAAAHAGQRLVLGAQPVTYGDFAAWEHSRATAGGFDDALGYWRRRLARAPAQTGFPFDRARPAEQPATGGRHELRVPDPLRAALSAYAGERGATPFMVLLAAFTALLRRYAAHDALVVAVPVAARSQPETRDVVGMFVNTVPLLLDVTTATTFDELVTQTRTTVLEALEHDVPFDLLVQELGSRPRTTVVPFAQIMFAYQAGMEPRLRFDAVEAQAFAVPTGTAKFDISLDAIDAGDELLCIWEYADALYDAQTVARFAEQFVRLLEHAVAAPHLPVADLAILSAEEHAQLLRWSAGECTSVPECTVDELFRDRARKRPEHVAVVEGERSTTYRELDERSDRLARHLRSQGVGRGRVVAILVERSTQAIVALLAVLKAGAAYLPLDERYPVERLRFVFEDAAPHLVLSERKFADRLPAHRTLRIFLDEEEPAGVPPSADALEPHDPSDLAYLLYTSGSSGRPKAVEVEHRSVVAFVSAIVPAYGLRADDRVLQFSSLSFDASAEEIFGTFTAGGTLVLATDEMRGSGVAFVNGCRGSGVTVLDLPTAYFHHLVDEIDARDLTIPASVRLALVGGEAMAPRVARSWRARTRARLINAYGPTEATVVASMHDVRDVAGDAATIPIGRPLPNASMYVLDAAQRLMPAGAPGMLYLGGPGVARGYRNRAELTASAFTRDPFRAGGRMYATGDIARIADRNGTFEIVGRGDGQVKIRGFRVETGEIEAALRANRSVLDCVVLARDDMSGTRRLAAYVVPAFPHPDAAADLARRLAQILPDYMIPAIVMLDALPIAVSGKIDRDALPPPADVADTADALLAPRDEVETALVAIWEELLQARPIGVRDNFFALGGHSLLAARVASRVERRFGATLTMRALFAAQTIEEMADAVRRAASRTQPA